MKSRDGQIQRREEKRRRKKIKKRESLRRKKIQVREKVGKSRNTVFFSTSLCGLLVFDSVSRLLLRRRLHRRLHLRPTIFVTQPLCHPPSLTHIFVTHNFVTHHLWHTLSFTHHFVTHHVSHTTLSHTILSHTIFVTHNFVTHHLSPLCHPPSFTHNFVTHNFVTHHLSHTTLSPTIFHTQLCRTQLCHMAGVALGDIHLRFAWQAWHLVTSTFVSRGRRVTWWHPLSFRMAGLALGHIHLRFAWAGHTQLCHTPSFTHIFVTHHLSHHLSHTTLSHTTLSHTIFNTITRGTVARDDMHLRFTWHAWHLETSTFVSRGRRGTWRHLVWRGRRGTWRHLPAFGVAGIALVALGGAPGRRWLPGAPRHFGWQAWHLETSTCVWRGKRGACSSSTCVWRGRRGTCCTWWRTWSPLVAVGRLGRRATLRGRRGTWWHSPSFCLAGLALGDIYLRLAWQAWHLLHLVARSVTVARPGRRGSPLLARGAALQHLVLIIGRSCLVALSGPLIPMILWLRKDQR